MLYWDALVSNFFQILVCLLNLINVFLIKYFKKKKKELKFSRDNRKLTELLQHWILEMAL